MKSQTGLSASGTNLLAVRVDNTKFPDIAPLSGDFSVYGGLYRPVHLLVTGNEDFTPLDHGSPGVAWLQTSVSQTQAVLDVTAQISNGTKDNQSQTLIATVLDAEGNPVASSEAKNHARAKRHRAVFPAHHRAAAAFVERAQRPLSLQGGRGIARGRRVWWIRSSSKSACAITQLIPDRGFFLNGQPYHLHGVDRHQDYMNKGWAISEADMDEDISLIKEIGATVIRCAHYQHSDYFYSLCDKAGILVWAEIPQVNEINGITGI